MAAGGTYPTWSKHGRELLFLGTDQRVMASAYSVVGESFRAEPPRPWAPFYLAKRTRGVAGLIDGRGFDVHPDGRRIVGAVVPESEIEARQNSVVFLFNFFDELRRLVPTANR